MLWKKQTNQSSVKNIFQMVHVNDRIRLDIRGHLYVSRIEDITAEHLVVSDPTGVSSNGLRIGQNVIIRVFTGVSVSLFSSTIASVIVNKVPLLSLTNFSYTGELRQRKNERAAVTAPIQYRPDDGTCGIWQDATMYNVSPDGLLIRTKENIYRADSFLELKLHLPSEEVMIAVAQITRTWSEPGAVYFGLQFAKLSLSSRQTIARFVRERRHHYTA